MSNTRKSVSSDIQTLWSWLQKLSCVSFLSVWIYDETLFLVFDILHLNSLAATYSVQDETYCWQPFDTLSKSKQYWISAWNETKEQQTGKKRDIGLRTFALIVCAQHCCAGNAANMSCITSCISCDWLVPKINMVSKTPGKKIQADFTPLDHRWPLFF